MSNSNRSSGVKDQKKDPNRVRIGKRQREMKGWTLKDAAGVGNFLRRVRELEREKQDLSALQFWVLGRRAGSLHPITALLFPLAVVVFAWIFLRSLVAIVLRREVTWKQRSVAARPD